MVIHLPLDRLLLEKHGVKVKRNVVSRLFQMEITVPLFFWPNLRKQKTWMFIWNECSRSLPGTVIMWSLRDHKSSPAVGQTTHDLGFSLWTRTNDFFQPVPPPPLQRERGSLKSVCHDTSLNRHFHKISTNFWQYLLTWINHLCALLGKCRCQCFHTCCLRVLEDSDHYLETFVDCRISPYWILFCRCILWSSSLGVLHIQKAPTIISFLWKGPHLHR